MTPNSFPLPGGVSLSFTHENASLLAGGIPGKSWNLISGLYYTKNFKLIDVGLWMVTANFCENDSSNQLVLNQTTGSVGGFDGTNTALITMNVSGYYPLSVPQGGLTCNFSIVSVIKTAALTLMSSGVLGL